MNPGMAIFRRYQRGTGDVRDKVPPFFVDGKWWWERGDEQARLDAEQAAKREQGGNWKPDSYKTIGVNINGTETEIPQWGGQTPNEAEQMARMRLEWGLDPFATDAELEAKQNAAHQGPDDASALPYADPTPIPGNYAHGTSNVNQGLYFYRKQLRKKKL